MLDASADESPKLELDAVVDMPSIEQKAEYIVHQLNNGPVLVFCDPPLTERLNVKLGALVLIVNDDTDYTLLRALDQ